MLSTNSKREDAKFMERKNQGAFYRHLTASETPRREAAPIITSGGEDQEDPGRTIPIASSMKNRSL